MIQHRACRVYQSTDLQYICQVIMGGQAAKPETKIDVKVDNTSEQEGGGVHLMALEFHRGNTVLSLVLMFVLSLGVIFVFNRFCKKKVCNPAMVATTGPDNVVIGGREFAPM